MSLFYVVSIVVFVSALIYSMYLTIKSFSTN